MTTKTSQSKQKNKKIKPTLKSNPPKMKNLSQFLQMLVHEGKIGVKLLVKLPLLYIF